MQAAKMLRHYANWQCDDSLVAVLGYNPPFQVKLFSFFEELAEPVRK